MIRMCIARGLVRLAACYETLADASAPRPVYPTGSPGYVAQERAARLRTSALKLRCAAIGVMMPRRARW